LLVDRRLSRTQNRILAASARAHTEFNQLCCGGQTEAIPGGGLLMQTDAEGLLEAGIATGSETFAQFLAEVGWDRDQIDRTICHQVGSVHRRRMLAALGLDAARDFATFDFLGNTGSVALPMTLALAVEQGLLGAGDQVAMLGIGSGINSLMIGLEWQQVPVSGVAVAAPAIAGAK
jgi:3-oxoacyl-[acyl-carrier-protein] synthase-3